jgi:hypothetical protein
MLGGERLGDPQALTARNAVASTFGLTRRALPAGGRDLIEFRPIELARRSTHCRRRALTKSARAR